MASEKRHQWLTDFSLGSLPRTDNPEVSQWNANQVRDSDRIDNCEVCLQFTTVTSDPHHPWLYIKASMRRVGAEHVRKQATRKEWGGMKNLGIYVKKGRRLQFFIRRQICYYDSVGGEGPLGWKTFLMRLWNLNHWVHIWKSYLLFILSCKVLILPSWPHLINRCQSNLNPANYN